MTCSRTPEYAVDVDLDCNSGRVLPRWPVSPFKGCHCGTDTFWRPIHQRRAFEREPPTAVYLAHDCPAGAFDVLDFLRSVGADDAHAPSVTLIGESDRHDVRRTIGAQRRQRPEVALGQEIDLCLGQFGMISGHASRPYGLCREQAIGS